MIFLLNTCILTFQERWQDQANRDTLNPSQCEIYTNTFKDGLHLNLLPHPPPPPPLLLPLASVDVTRRASATPAKRRRQNSKLRILAMFMLYWATDLQYWAVINSTMFRLGRCSIGNWVVKGPILGLSLISDYLQQRSVFFFFPSSHLRAVC